MDKSGLGAGTAGPHSEDRTTHAADRIGEAIVGSCFRPGRNTGWCVAGKGSPDTPVSGRRGIGKKFGRRLNVQQFGQNDLIARPRGFQIRDHLGVIDKIVDEFGFYRQLHRVLDLQNRGFVLCKTCAGTSPRRAPEPNGTLNNGAAAAARNIAENHGILGSRLALNKAGSRRLLLETSGHLPSDLNSWTVHPETPRGGDSRGPVCGKGASGRALAAQHPGELRSVLTATQAGVGPTTTKPPSLPQGLSR
jgi:hypothetical protein